MANLESLILAPNTRANQPAAGIAGRIYFVTDEGVVERDNGTTWEDYSAAGMTNPMTTQGDVIYGGASGTPTRLAKGTAAQVLTMNAGATAPEWSAAGGGATLNDYILVRDEKASTTNGGSFTSGAWRTRDITAEASDTGGHCSLPGSNVIRLAAGTYIYAISAVAVYTALHQARLYDVTAGAVVTNGEGTSEDANAANTTSRSIIKGKFTISGSNDFRIEHRAQTTSNTIGFGAANSFGEKEIYTIAEFWKVA